MKDKELKSIVVLTGAGVSAESEIETFRDSDGLRENHRLEDVATPQAFLRDPKLIHRLYNARRRQLIALFYMKAIEEALLTCDLFVSVGTSGHVYPAAEFGQLANRVGAHTVELNLEPSVGESQFADGHYGLATEEVSRFFGNL